MEVSKLFICGRGHISLVPWFPDVVDEDQANSCPACGGRGRISTPPSDYEALAPLGQGGMGVVYKARQAATGRVVAIKMLNPIFQNQEEKLARIMHEAEAVAALDHPNIIKIFGKGRQDGVPYLALECLEGKSLADECREGRVEPRRAAGILETLAKAIHFAHRRGIIHRDLKPSNVLRAIDGELKITDFGLAKFIHSEKGVTTSGLIMGTPAYMSPEQARGSNRLIGPHSDVYSLGAIFYQMLTGRTPFRGETAMDLLHAILFEDPIWPSLLVRGLPPQLCTICMTCLERDIPKRFATAEELAKELRAFLDGAPDQVECGKVLDESHSGQKDGHEGSRPGAPADDAPIAAVIGDEPETISEVQRIDPDATPNPALFGGLAAEHFNDLLRCGIHREYEVGQVIFRHGDPARGLFVILQGKVLIYKKLEADVLYLRQLGTDEVFGEMGLLLESGERTASAQALEKTTLLEIPGNPFELVRLFGDSGATGALLDNLMRILWDRYERKGPPSATSFSETDLLGNWPEAGETRQAEENLRKKIRAYLKESRSKPHQLPSGEHLFRQGDPADRIYAIKKGSLEISKTGPDGERISQTVGESDMVGELGFFLQVTRDTEAVGLETITYHCFSRLDLERMEKRDRLGSASLRFAAAQLLIQLILDRERAVESDAGPSLIPPRLAPC